MARAAVKPMQAQLEEDLCFLIDCVSKLQQDVAHTLTPLHADVAERCMLMGRSDLFRDEIVAIPYQLNPFAPANPKGIARFYFAAGSMLSAQHEYERAFEYLSLLFSVQLKAVEGVHIAALKKLAFVSIIQHETVGVLR